MLLLERNRDDPGVTFGKITLILTEFKALRSESMSELERDMMCSYPGLFHKEDFPYLCEVIGVNSTNEAEATDNSMKT